MLFFSFISKLTNESVHNVSTYLQRASSSIIEEVSCLRISQLDNLLLGFAIDQTNTLPGQIGSFDKEGWLVFINCGQIYGTPRGNVKTVKHCGWLPLYQERTKFLVQNTQWSTLKVPVDHQKKCFAQCFWKATFTVVSRGIPRAVPREFMNCLPSYF